MTLLLSDADVRDVCDLGRLIVSLEQMFRDEERGPGPILPERLNLGLGETFLRVMPAILPGSGLMGLKFFHGSLRDGVRYVVLLCSTTTGEVEAIVDAAFLTAARTGATSGVATKVMARPDAATVGLIGSGLEARTNLAAVCAVRPITKVKVYSPSPQRRQAFADEMSRTLAVEIVAQDTPAAAVRGTDIVIAATNTGVGGPIALRGEWLERGQHVVSIGSTTLGLREIDERCFLRADAVVLDADLSQMQNESGDVAALLAAEPGWDKATSLSDVAASGFERTGPEQLTVFKSVGSAAQDLVGAAHAVVRAREVGRGTEVADVAVPKVF